MAAFFQPFNGGQVNYSNFNSYTILRTLGEGTFGVTYHVTKNSREYALKKLKLNILMTNPQEAMREISILRQMNHKNIVGYDSSFLDEYQNVCIVMEYCEHGDLLDLIRTGNARASTKDFIIAAMHQICSGLEYVHSKMVIHRDIKPTNIFVHKSATLKIGDFGCSKVISSGVFLQSPYVIGTDGYMAPEILSQRSYSFKSDMFAAGRVLFDLCTSFQLVWNPDNPVISNVYSGGIHRLLQMLTVRDPSQRLSASDALGILSQMDPTQQLPIEYLSVQGQYTGGASQTRFVNIDHLLQVTLCEMVPSLRRS